MVKRVTSLLKDSKSARWIVLISLSLPMFASYFFDDIFSTISHLFQNPQMLELGWSLGDYGFYGGAYSLLCVWGGLVICGMLLDKWGVRFTGSLFVSLMLIGSVMVLYAISESFASSRLSLYLQGAFNKPSLAIAYAGCAIFGLGSEIAGVAVNRSIAKWFRGKEMAFAMGIQLALARLGTATALIIVPRIVNTSGYVPFSETSKPAIIGLILIVVGVLVWSLFVAMDYKFDRQAKELAISENKVASKEDKFKFSDVIKVLTNKQFILISLLCVFFYCCIITFRKFATSIIIPRFDIDDGVASLMVSMIPFSTLVFSPLFGALVDRFGKGTKLMILGSFLVFFAHLTIAFAPGIPIFGYIGIAVLGLGYSLVPAAMWPSIPKIIPEKNLGTAFSLVYWIQNMGMLLVPIFVGSIIERSGNPVNAEYLFISLSIVAILLSFLFSRSSDKHPEFCLDKKNK